MYKIARENSNPTTSMCKKQYPACRDILVKEIEDCKPTHILIITGIDWWNDKKDGCNFAEDISGVKLNKEYGKHTKGNSVYVEATAEYRLSDGRSVPVAVTCRPEFCKQKDFVEAVMEKFLEGFLIKI